ncbi:hypothetical protein ACRDU6_13025 [Mycolicibacterium sp. ELW1]|uniref:hypothetical protein n=1 Tax=Mycobacteriaceae TaxID=1762 RepID=UPI0011ED18A8|nr:hypothetical protein [Mycobacterium sp. ELW1]QEN13468.1 hypothetical protein D3H54_09580 [Mycobacterium sp. ELW1]
MATGTLYRPAARDAHGDPVDAEGNVVHVGGEVGTISGLVVGGPKWQPAGQRGDIVDTTGLVGVPLREPVQPEHGDTLVMDGVKFKIQGPPQWASRGLVTTTPRYRWFTITAVAN